MGTIEKIIENVIQRNPNEPLFQNVIKNVYSSLKPVAEKKQDWVKAGIFDRLTEPDKQIIFSVIWVDDKGETRSNRGYRVQFNRELGPYAGGFKFSKDIDLDTVKAMAFEQVLKNSLSGMQIGGAFGGADIDLTICSENEKMRFCQSYMDSLQKFIGDDTDLIIDHISTNERELGYMYGRYLKYKEDFYGLLTGDRKLLLGGSHRKKASGYGLGYLLEEALQAKGKTFNGSTVVVSGCGDASIYAIKKSEHLGAKVIALSDKDGYIYDPNGIEREVLKPIKNREITGIRKYVDSRPGSKYIEGKDGIWSLKCDIAIPSQSIDEIDSDKAKLLISNGCFGVGEGAHMAVTKEAVDIFKNSGTVITPAKASNAGAVAISTIEMTKSSIRSAIWGFAEYDARLKYVMANVYKFSNMCAKEFGCEGDLVAGADIAAFVKIADAIYAKGI